ncbi:Protein rogdi-like protein [Trichoplax sp. H2]|nr:Protein rogdi-like protein [Trichoplax sp. H2]|eukprot:RDD44809.1 Protein rogdi-like protein [Trichoplax sp. H2]
MAAFANVTPLRQQLQKENVNKGKEFQWLLHYDLPQDFNRLGEFIKISEQNLGVMNVIVEDSEAKPENFKMTLPQKDLVKGIITINADSITKADITVTRPSKVNPTQVSIGIRECWPLRLFQLRDATRFVNITLKSFEQTKGKLFKSGDEIIDNFMNSLSQAETALILPTIRHPAEILNSESSNMFDPPLPEDVLTDFYINRDQLIMKLYFFNLKSPNQASQIQYKPGNTSLIGTTFINTQLSGAKVMYEIAHNMQVETCIPRLSNVLRSISLALRLCQQMKDKVQASRT